MKKIIAVMKWWFVLLREIGTLMNAARRTTEAQVPIVSGELGGKHSGK
jgi:hypothetical protein